MDSDHVRPDELVLSGGEWGALLFENQHVGLPLSLSWSFTFDYETVSRDYGSVEPGFTIDRVDLGRCDWREMAGRHARGEGFADPIESSVYFFEHHRFDRVDLQVMEQRGDRIRVAAEATGDLDGLGIEPFRAEGWLRFRGVIVQPQSLPESITEARTLLSTFTDADGLTGSRGAHNFKFIPPPK